MSIRPLLMAMLVITTPETNRSRLLAKETSRLKYLGDSSIDDPEEVITKVEREQARLVHAVVSSNKTPMASARPAQASPRLCGRAAIGSMLRPILSATC